tara:strand:- start:824 stop:2473 length:1650 start_codon:yes stop_codon:yes gene_type:complete
MSKTIPTESIIVLQNKIDMLPKKNFQRTTLINECAHFYGVSISTVYRALAKHASPQASKRADFNTPRKIIQSDMKRYCEIIAAIKHRTKNKKGTHLSTKESILILENFGVQTPNGLIKAPSGVLRKSTVDRYLYRWGLTPESIHIEPCVVRFQAEYSNDCWQFDFSPSDLKQFKIEGYQPNAKLMLISVVDDRSGITYQEYVYVPGEDAMTALKFLFNAMAPKKKKNMPFQGIPKVIYLDNGPVAKSKMFRRVMAYLGIEIKTHLPKDGDGRRTTSRSKGKVERPFRTVKTSLESKYHFHQPQSLEEANAWLTHYLDGYNDMPHRSESHSRLDDWKRNIPEQGFREMCTWKKFSSFVREPEQKKVHSDATINVNGVVYQLPPELAGKEITILLGLFDNEIHIEYEDKKEGPFYPSNGPVLFNTFKSHKKSHQEKVADKIEVLASEISIPIEVLSGNNSTLITAIQSTDLVPDSTVSIPFQEDVSKYKYFNSKIDAKVFISEYLGKPLAHLTKNQMAKIDSILLESLEKKIVLAQVKELMSFKVLKGRIA